VAQFFIHPLLSGDAAGREIDAVNSEHEKNLQDDSRALTRPPDRGRTQSPFQAETHS